VNSFARTYDEHEGGLALLPISSQQAFPPSPFPCKYLHCVFTDLENVVQAAFALHADGHDSEDIHIMSCWDYVAAVERKRQQQSQLAKKLTRLLTLMDEGFGDIYLHEAQRGNHILMVHLPRRERIQRVRDLLLLHNARLIRYVDTWTVTYLSR
jgi:hypothetical protein